MCIRCGSDRILKIRARAKDMHTYEYNEQTYEGYAMDFSADGDTTELSVCLECGQVQDKFPMKSVLEEV